MGTGVAVGNAAESGVGSGSSQAALATIKNNTAIAAKNRIIPIVFLLGVPLASTQIRTLAGQRGAVHRGALVQVSSSFAVIQRMATFSVIHPRSSEMFSAIPSTTNLFARSDDVVPSQWSLKRLLIPFLVRPTWSI